MKKVKNGGKNEKNEKKRRKWEKKRVRALDVLRD